MLIKQLTGTAVFAVPVLLGHDFLRQTAGKQANKLEFYKVECDCMKCPYCNNEMEKGKLRSRGGVYFLPDGEKTPLLYTEREMKKRNAVYLPPNIFSDFEYPTAHICRSCSKIVLDY